MVNSIRELSKEYRTAQKEHLPAMGEKICQWALLLPELKTAKTVFAFCSTPLEPDTSLLLKSVLASGKTLLLPLCEEPGVMTARQILSLDQLQIGAYGIMEPAEDSKIVPPCDIDLVFVPCSAMDRCGGRIGKGGGYYDRFLSGYEGCMAALCPEQLLFDLLPQQSHDVNIPIIITENGIIRCR